MKDKVTFHCHIYLTIPAVSGVPAACSISCVNVLMIVFMLCLDLFLTQNCLGCNSYTTTIES